MTQSNKDLSTMEMPVMCECGVWFDLNDGYGKEDENVTVCESCHNKEVDAREFWEECETEFLDGNFRMLSWNQPFASLMLHGKIETRRKSTNVRGKVLICACKKFYSFDQVKNLSCDYQIGDLLNLFSVISYSSLQNKLPIGVAIAVGDLINCRPHTLQDMPKSFVNHDANLFSWVFENVKQIDPFEIKGKQGWGFVTEDILNKIRLKQ